MKLKLEVIRLANEDVIATSCLCAKYGENMPHKSETYTHDDDYYSMGYFCKDILDDHETELRDFYNTITPLEGKICPEHGQMYEGKFVS